MGTTHGYLCVVVGCGIEQALTRILSLIVLNNALSLIGLLEGRSDTRWRRHDDLRREFGALAPTASLMQAEPLMEAAATTGKPRRHLRQEHDETRQQSTQSSAQQARVPTVPAAII